MARARSVQEVVTEMAEALLATPSRKKRLLSKTFWRAFGFERRSDERIASVQAALDAARIHVVRPEEGLGTEDWNDDWVELTYLEEQPDLPRVPATMPDRPSSEWFKRVATQVYESEREVEYYLALPLLRALGYGDDDMAVGFPVRMNEGVRRVTKEADCVVFDGPGRSRADALIVLEAKRAERQLTEEIASQARSYALWMTTPFYLLTNGNELKVFMFRGALQADVNMLTTARERLEEDWSRLAQLIAKPSARDYKDRLAEALTRAVFPPDELSVAGDSGDRPD